MSFYFDDFDDYGDDTQPGGLSQSQGQSQGDEQVFLCANCGGSEGYEDAVGVMCCANCFTQSQDMAYEKETTMAFEEVMAVAARTKGGRILASQLNKKKKAAGAFSNRRVKKPLEELDTSKPLPDLKLCIHAFTTVLQGGVKSVGKIMRLDDGEQQALMESVGKIWMTYLRAWSDGAEKYGARYPDLRFSFRDGFLSQNHRNLLFRVLSYKVAKSVRTELAAEKAKEDGNGDDSARATGLDQTPIDVNDDSDDQSIEEQPENSQNSKVDSGDRRDSSMAEPSGNQQSRKRKRKDYKDVGALLRQSPLWYMRREEAALSLRPSMNLVAAILWFALARIGITPGQLSNWIANGSLPLLNAFQRLLSADDQQELKLLRSFFKMNLPPKTAKIESQAAFLAVACGIKSTEDVPQFKKVEGEEATKDVEKATRVQRILNRLRFVSIGCVPLMIGQLVADLRLGQRVLDIALSLIGSEPLAHKGESPPPWLPGPLKRTHPSKIATPEYALAVIVVACKMCPGWESWTYAKMPPSGHTKEYLGTTSSGQPNADHSKKRNENHQRFVPWNEEQFSLLRNENVSDYLDFIEEIILVNDSNNKDTKDGSFQKISALMEEACDKNHSRDESGNPRNTEQNSASTSAGEVLLPGVSKACENNLSRDESGNPRNTEQNSASTSACAGEVLLPGVSNAKHEELLCRRPKNYIPYLTYPDKTTHTREGPRRCDLTPEPFHSYYTRLIEYMAYKIRVHAHKIHSIVTFIDEEIVLRCNPGKYVDPEEKKEKKRQRRAQQRKAKSAQALGTGEPGEKLQASQASSDYAPLETFSLGMSEAAGSTQGDLDENAQYAEV